MSFLSGAAQNNFTPQGTQEALGNYNTANKGFNQLAEALRQQMAGNGPNLANAQLQQTTGQNIANQASLMAGQRGGSANVGLLARQIGQQGANIQQQAVGQASINRLAEQLGAQQQLQGVYGTQGQLGAGILNSNNQIGAGIASENATKTGNLIGGVGAIGGKLLGLANGGQVPNQPNPTPSWSDNFLSMNKPQMMASGGGVNRLPFSPATDYRAGGQVMAQSPDQRAQVRGNSYANDKIPAMVSEGEYVLNREIMQSPNAPELAAQAVRRALSRGKK